MTLIIPTDYASVSVIHSLTGDSEPIVNTFGIHMADFNSLTPALADAIMLEWGAAFAGLISNQYVLEQVVLYGTNSLGPSEVVVSTESPVTYTNDNGPLPQNCAVLIRKRTDTAGRRGRGRMYVPGIQESNVGTTGVIVSGLRDLWQTAADDFLTGLQALTSVQDMVVLHNVEGIGTEPPPSPVLSLTVDEKIATQRRRLRP